MPLTFIANPKSICNLGLRKIAANEVSSLEPPRTATERHCADGYMVWRNSELMKGRWAFAVRSGAVLTLSDPPTVGVREARPYFFARPLDMLNPVREKYSTWEYEQGGFFYSENTLTIDYVRKVTEADFPDSFIMVLAARVAIECCELATNSTTKTQQALAFYQDAIKEAKRVNAFLQGPQDVRLADYNDTWLTSRMGYEV